MLEVTFVFIFFNQMHLIFSTNQTLLVLNIKEKVYQYILHISTNVLSFIRTFVLL